MEAVDRAKFIICAETESDLKAKLPSIEELVAPVLASRQTWQREIHTIIQFLKWFCNEPDCLWPVTVFRTDDFGTKAFPDFQCAFGGNWVGVEVSELISQNYADAREWQEHFYPDRTIAVGLPNLRWGSKPLLDQEVKSRHEKLKALNRILEPQKERLLNFLASPGVRNGEGDSLLAQAVKHWVERKSPKIPDAREYWLLLYVNLDTSIRVNEAALQVALAEFLSAYSEKTEQRFSRILLQTGWGRHIELCTPDQTRGPA